MSADFDAWADLYRIWTDLVPGTDAELYRRMAEESGRPVVDLGIGLGRVAQVVKPDVGIDISPAMLDEAGRRLGPGGSTRLMRASIADYALDRPAAFSYAAQNTLNHVAPAEHPILFHTVLRNTRPGGRFAFETAMAQPARLRMRDRVPVLRAYGGERAIFDITRLTDPSAQRAELIGMVDRIDSRGHLVERRYFPPIPFTFFTPSAIRGWAEAAGWQVESVHAGPEGDPLADDSPSALWCLRRPDRGARAQ